MLSISMSITLSSDVGHSRFQKGNCVWILIVVQSLKNCHSVAWRKAAACNIFGDFEVLGDLLVDPLPVLVGNNRVYRV